MLSGFDEAKLFLGKLCKYGHEWEDSRKCLRYLGNGGCVTCNKTAKKAKYQANRKQAIAQSKTWVKNNPSKVKEIKARYREKHRKELRRKNKEYAERNKEKIRNKNRIYYARPEIKLKDKLKHQTPQAKLRRSINKQKRRIRDKQVWSTNYSIKELQHLHETFDNQCAYCGSTESLTLDHVIPISKGGVDTLSNLIIACVRCNCSKNNNDLETWYRQQEYFSFARWKKIQKYCGLILQGQLPLF